MPFFNLTVQVFVPTHGTLVSLFTPGPVSRKLWMFDLSRMTMVYVPAVAVFLLIVIVKPGPSVPISVLLRDAAGARPGRASTAAIAATAAASSSRTRVSDKSAFVSERVFSDILPPFG